MANIGPDDEKIVITKEDLLLDDDEYSLDDEGDNFDDYESDDYEK